VKKHQIRFDSLKNFFPQESFNESEFSIIRTEITPESENDERTKSLNLSFFSPGKMKSAREHVQRSLKQIQSGCWDAEK